MMNCPNLPAVVFSQPGLPYELAFAHTFWPPTSLERFFRLE
jgi:hypothetical protein